MHADSPATSLLKPQAPAAKPWLPRCTRPLATATRAFERPLEASTPMLAEASNEGSLERSAQVLTRRAAYGSTCETDSPQTVQRAWMMPRGHIACDADAVCVLSHATACAQSVTAARQTSKCLLASQTLSPALGRCLCTQPLPRCMASRPRASCALHSHASPQPRRCALRSHRLL